MELKDFISNTIEQFSFGIINASTKCKEYGVIVNPSVIVGHSGDYSIPKKAEIVNITRRIQMISMDIAVSQIESKDGELNGKLRVSFLSVGSNLIEGESLSSENRVTFTIPVVLPVDGDYSK